MGDLFNREFSLNLGGVLIRSNNPDNSSAPVLRVVFDIELNLVKDPNTIDLQIYNLKRDTRSRVAAKGTRTTFEAGYFGRTSIIFDGKIDFGSTRREGADWITEFQSTDGGDAARKARINEVLASGTTIEQALKVAAEKTNLGLGNALEKIKAGNIRGALKSFSGGIVLSGKATEQLNKIVELTGFDWSIQQGQIQLLEPDGAIDPNLAIVLSPTTGLIGSPQPGDEGIVAAKSLLIPDLLPGRRVEIRSAEVNGFHRIERVRFTGDTWGNDWYADIEAKPL
jgi:hypothetical protein